MRSYLKSYLLVVDTTQRDTALVIQVIDRLPDVLNWYKFLPAALTLVTALSLPNLQKLLLRELSGTRYLVSLIEPEKKNGWLPKPAWELMNMPVPAAG